MENVAPFFDWYAHNDRVTKKAEGPPPPNKKPRNCFYPMNCFGRTLQQRVD